MIELNKMVSSDISNNIIFLKIKNDILKNLLGSYMIHNQITFLNSLLLKDYNYWVNSISFKKKKKNIFLICEQEKKFNSSRIKSSFFLFTNEILVHNFQKTFYLNSLIKNFKKIEINFKDKDSSTQVSIQSANKTLKQEIVKMLEIEQKLGFFEISIYSINSLHSKIKQKMIEIRGTKKDIFKNKIINTKVIYFVFLIFVLFSFTFYFI